MLAQASSDTATGVAALAVFLILVFALGFAIAKVQRFRHAAAWRPLLVMIDGRVEPGMGPNTTVARGVYRDHPVVLTAMPGVPLGPGADELVHYNRLVIRMFGVDGAVDWQVGIDGGGWAVRSADPALVARLTEAGVAALAAEVYLPMDEPLAGISFDHVQRYLEMNASAGECIVPSRLEFERLLETMVAIVGINVSLNAVD